MQARDISRKLKENGAKKGSARARSRQVLPYSAIWLMLKSSQYNIFQIHMMGLLTLWHNQWLMLTKGINPLTPASNCPRPTPNFRALFGIFQREQKHKNKPYA